MKNSGGISNNAFEELFAYLEDDFNDKSKQTRMRSAKLTSNGKVFQCIFPLTLVNYLVVKSNIDTHIGIVLMIFVT